MILFKYLNIAKKKKPFEFSELIGREWFNIVEISFLIGLLSFLGRKTNNLIISIIFSIVGLISTIVFINYIQAKLLNALAPFVIENMDKPDVSNEVKLKEAGNEIFIVSTIVLVLAFLLTELIVFNYS